MFIFYFGLILVIKNCFNNYSNGQRAPEMFVYLYITLNIICATFCTEFSGHLDFSC